MSAAKNRPQRRTSGLSGQSPVTPAAAAPAAQPAPAATTPAAKRTEANTATRKSAPAKAAAADAPKSKYPPKVSFYQDPEDTARVRGALRGVMNQPDAATNMSQFINRAVMREVERLEAQYNQGKPFAPVQPGGVPRGRPMGE